MVGHVGVDALVAGGRDGVAFDQRPAGEGALQRIGRALQPDVGLRRREDDARRGLRFGLAHLDEIARADAGIGALQAVEADDVDPLVLAIGTDRARRGRPLADDLDHVAFVRPSSSISLSGSRAKPRPLSAGGRLATWTLRDVTRSIVSVFRHRYSSPALSYRMRNGAQHARFISWLNI